MQRTPTIMCGIPVDDITLPEALDRIVALVERGRATGRTHQVATVNVDFMVNALADPELMAVLQRTDLAVPDGMPIVWGSRWAPPRLRERVAGADLVPALAERCALTGHSMYLFGAAPGVADRAATLLRRRFPGLEIASDSGPVLSAPEDMPAAALERIRQRRPDILCVALGHPKQERWIDVHREALGVPVLIGVGGALDFLTGTQRRAPQWMQQSGTEWLYRLLHDPQRLARRYGRDLLRFGPRLAWEISTLRAKAPAGQTTEVVRSGATTVLRPKGQLRLDAVTLGWTDEEWQRPEHDQRLIIDLRSRMTLSRRELSEIVGLARHLHDGGGELTLVAVQPELARTLLRHRLYGFLPTASDNRHLRAYILSPTELGSAPRDDAGTTVAAVPPPTLEPAAHA